ncbi:MAG: alpha/beta fold hydrolase [Cyanobacteria bacterium SZAS LIN-3]|nr:alpha/beta fold hydrolase [Cyanobacteria bacterium SZAS LIN-3]
MSGLTNTSQLSIVYLHGFASGNGSTKAKFFKQKFEEAGIDIVVPDLNVPTFEDMTLSAQLSVVDAEARKIAADKSIVLMGSSMGGLLAAIAAESIVDSERLILLAPGFGITRRWRELIGEEGMEQWQRTGQRSFFHYARNKELPLNYSFIEDLSAHKTEGFKVKVPALVIHGINDDTVPIDHSREFAKMNPRLTTLIELDEGHELTSDLNRIWLDVERFLNIQNN